MNIKDVISIILIATLMAWCYFDYRVYRQEIRTNEARIAVLEKRECLRLEGKYVYIDISKSKLRYGVGK